MFQITHKKVNPQKLAGYYHDNYIVESNGQKYIYRVPIPEAQSMDLRIIPESLVLRFLKQKFFPAPRLKYADSHARFFIHSYIDGDLFQDLYPATTPFPNWICGNLAIQMKTLHQFSPKMCTPHCSKLPKSPDSSGFFQYLIALVEGIYGKYKKSYGSHFEQLQFPPDPFDIVRINALKLKTRPFTLCHCDIHRQNLIIPTKNARNLVILDWELALVADPFYDIATHLHKMNYAPGQELIFLETYLGQLRATLGFKDSWNQIQIYLQLERIKSAIVDLVRMAERFQAESSESQRKSIATDYQKIIEKAWGVWNKDLPHILSRTNIYQILDLS
uniref:Phosphotransferase enzyme family protein n=1 Tax=Promethearchaeum syntrophicum TaxID=2594042 RepID=A0A5B9DF96_9ARCH|nr:aminoglycoside phosphotransferase family protein [Candidatus Prometheoarchaeum syntrophicum]QEE17725.1 Phosphotransferase enzyme family protein [Candidatus Prometheoarchaeum syntrophicum]